jgi:hypothetical protein
MTALTMNATEAGAAGPSPQIYARVAGALYLSLLPLGLFALLYVPAALIVPGDAAATAGRILASEGLFRLSIVAALLVQLINILVVLALYRLLRPVNRDWAALMVVFLFMAVPIAMLSEVNHLAALLFMNRPELLSLLLDLHEQGITIASIFWGLWLFPMGYLVFRSGFLPRFLGILLMIGCFGYLIDSFAAFLLPAAGIEVVAFTFWGEVLLPLWLVIKGVNVKQWNKRAAESA